MKEDYRVGYKICYISKEKDEETKSPKKNPIIGFRVSSQLKIDFEKKCKEKGLTSSTVLKKFVEDFIN